MNKPKFQFLAHEKALDDESGIAIWRYIEVRGTGNGEVVCRQEFPSFRAAFAIDGLIAVAFAAGDANGHARCAQKVLDAVKSDAA